MGKKYHSFEEEQFLIKLGAHLRLLRERHNLTQSRLSEMIEMSTQTISAIENGSADCQISTLYKIAEAYKINVSELLEFKI